MKRKSTLILIAALVLAVTIPVFAFAAGYGNSSARFSGRGNTAPQAAAVQQSAQLMLQDCDLIEDCDCEAQGTGLGADGERLYLNFTDGAQARTFFLQNCPWIN